MQANRQHASSSCNAGIYHAAFSDVGIFKCEVSMQESMFLQVVMQVSSKQDVMIHEAAMQANRNPQVAMQAFSKSQCMFPIIFKLRSRKLPCRKACLHENRKQACKILQVAM